MNKKLSTTELKFIESNLDKMTMTAIARHLNCSFKTIDRYKRKLANKQLNPNPIDPSESTESLGSIDNKRDKNFWINDLNNSARGRRVRGMLTKEEWVFYCEDWVGYHLQLEDLNHTEENNIEQIIMLKLRIDKNQADYSKDLSLRDSVMQENGIRDLKDLDLTNPKQASIYEKVFAAQLRMQDLTKEYKDLLERNSKISEGLNITRKQREERGKVGADTFFTLCKKFDSRKVRSQEGRMAGLFKNSTEKKTEELRNAVEFMDGEMAPQLLDVETVRKMRNENE